MKITPNLHSLKQLNYKDVSLSQALNQFIRGVVCHFQILFHCTFRRVLINFSLETKQIFIILPQLGRFLFHL